MFIYTQFFKEKNKLSIGPLVNFTLVQPSHFFEKDMDTFCSVAMNKYTSIVWLYLDEINNMEILYLMHRFLVTS